MPGSSCFRIRGPEGRCAARRLFPWTFVRRSNHSIGTQSRNSPRPSVMRGFVEGPTGDRAHSVEAGEDGRKAAVWRNLVERGIELLAEPIEAVGIHFA